MLEFLTNEKMEQLKSQGYTLIFVYNSYICYENLKEELKFPLISNGKKTNYFYYILTKGENLLKHQNLNHFSKNIKSLEISCDFDYEDEVDLENDSYNFCTDIPSMLYERKMTTFYDIPTEVIILKEEDIFNYLKNED